MNTELPLLLVIGGGCLVIGYALSGLLHSLRGEKELPTKPPAAVEQGKPAADQEVLSLQRKPGQPGLLVRMDGKVYRAAADMNESTRQRLKQTLQETSNTFFPELDEKTSFSAPTAPQVLPQAAAPTVQILPAERTARKGPLTPFIKAIQPGQRVPAANTPTGLAEQVDEVLQRMILARSLPYQNLYLVTSPTQELLVILDDVEYDGIEAVPDESARALIREAVKEWEKRG